MDNAAWIGLQSVIVLFLGLIGLNIVIKIWSDKINLNSLLSEPDGKASLSRFQLLLFTFVIVGIYVVLCLQQGDLIEISNGVLGLLGISGGSYVISKGIQTQADKTQAGAPKNSAKGVRGGGV
jgi:hypothetical protein